MFHSPGSFNGQSGLRQARIKSRGEGVAKLYLKDENKPIMEGVWGRALLAEGTAKAKAKRRGRAWHGPGEEWTSLQ